MKRQRTSRSWFIEYSFAFVVTGLAVLISLLIYPVIVRIPSALCLCAVILSALYGGFGPGLLASFLSLLALDYFFLPPTFQWSLTAENGLSLMVFLLAAVGVSAATAGQHRAQQLIAANREWLQTTLASIGDAVIVTDTEGRIVFLNAVAETLTGWNSKETLGQSIQTVFNIINQDTRLPVENPLTRVLREGIVVGLANHTVLITKQGTEIPIDDSGAPVLDADNKLTGAVLIFRDITEQRSHQRVAAHLAAIVESSDDTILSIDLNGVITSWNRGAVKMYGYTAEEVIGQPVSILVPPDRPNDVFEMLERLKRGEQIEHYETERQVKTGQIISAAITISPVHDAYGKLVGASKISRDITERKQRVQALQQSLQREQDARYEVEKAKQRLEFLSKASQLLSSSLDYKTTFQHLRTLILPDLADLYTIDVLQPDNTLHRVVGAAITPELESLLQEADRRYPPDLARLLSSPTFQTGKSILWANLTPETIAAAAKDADHVALLRQMNPTSEILIPLHIRARSIGVLTVVRCGGSTSYTDEDVALFEELSNRVAQTLDNVRLFNDTQQAVQLRDEFLSVAAHELRTPVTSMRGFSQTLLRLADKGQILDQERIVQSLRTIDSQSTKLATLIEQLLDISRIEAGRLVLAKQDNDLSALLQSIVTEMQRRTSQHTLTLNCPDSFHATVDPVRLEQVLVNLLDNAIKYSPKGGSITVIATPGAEEIEISVQDNGIGIPPERRQNLFNRFYQAHGDGTLGGMGLGLYISRQIVELHSGSLTAEFPAQGGTRMIICLPTHNSQM